MPGRSVASVLLLLALLFLRPVARAETDGEDAIDDGPFHFDVSPPVVPRGVMERREHFRALEAKDLRRHQRVSVGRRQARETGKVPEVMSDTEMFLELPMRSALNIAHVGMYLVSVRFGTPALPFNLVLDTANDLTWMSCRLRRRKGKHYGRSSPSSAQTMSVGAEAGGGAAAPGPAPAVKKNVNYYRPALSSSWRRIRCLQVECGALPYTTCSADNPASSCSYFQK